MKLVTFFKKHARKLKASAALGAVVAAPAAIYAYVPPAGGAAQPGNDFDFDATLNTLQQWSEGSLGVVIAITLMLAGIGMGIMKQSIAAVIPGIAAAIALSEGPGILINVFGATV